MPECVECGSEAEAHPRPRPLCGPCLESLMRPVLAFESGRQRSLGVLYTVQEGLSLKAASRALDRCYRQYSSGVW